MWDSLELTADETVRIEEKFPGYVRYQDINGRRWEVFGTCDRRGFCMVGAVINVRGQDVLIESVEHLVQLAQDLGVDRIDSEMDVPVGPGFEGCCPLEVTVLGD